MTIAIPWSGENVLQVDPASMKKHYSISEQSMIRINIFIKSIYVKNKIYVIDDLRILFQFGVMRMSATTWSTRGA